MRIRKFLISLLGGYTEDEIANRAKYISDYNQLLLTRSEQLDIWFMAFTELTHNFNSRLFLEKKLDIEPLIEKKFDEVTSDRISRVSSFYRAFSWYFKENYEIAEDENFKELQKELQSFVTQEFYQVFYLGFFCDEAFKKFESLEKKYKEVKTVFESHY